VSSDPALTQVLLADPALAARLPAEVVDSALLLAVAESQWLPTGPWDPLRVVGDEPGHLGLLVLEGMVARHARLLASEAIELLGAGDLLRPWQPDEAAPFLADESRWEVLMPTHVAVLDRRFAAIAGRWPELTAALADRAMRRSRDLTLGMAVAQIPKVHLRLLAVLWHIALRWGVAEEEGLALPIRLPHELLAHLVVARRQTTTAALGTLVKGGHVSRRSDGRLVLAGTPPADLQQLSAARA
jgi:CRP/FNR family cyclic AMP-dependent transcriptional regulator